MVCSFLQNETIDQINNFLNSRNNFVHYSFDLLSENIKYSRFLNDNSMLTLPDTVLGYTIDGYFAAYLKKIK